MSWAARPHRFFQHLLREVDAVGLDPARLVEEARSMGANGYLAMGGGFSAWYPTQVAAQPRNPHLQGDVLGGVLDAGRRAGMRVLARMDISKARPGAAEAHPDWFVRRPDGGVATVWAMPQICATGPFWREVNFAILDEILGRYRLDGLFYNYLHVARCHCDRCRRLVRAATGADVPAPGTRSPTYERWRQRTLAAAIRDMRDFVRARQPEALVVPYHHVRDGWDYRAMADAAGLVSAQVSNPVVPNPVDPQPMWTHWAAEEALLARAAKPGTAPLLIQTASAFFASRQTAMPAGRLVRNMAQAAAHGAQTCPALNGLLGGGDARAEPALRALGRHLGRHASWYAGLSPTARVALVRSDDSVAWGPDAGRPAGDPAGRGHVAEFRGLFALLTDLRYPLAVLPAGGLTVAELRDFAVVVLPGLSCLSGEDAAALEAYLLRGGALIATGETATANEDGRPRATAPDWLPGPAGAPRAVAGAYLAAREPARLGAPWLGVDGLFWPLSEAPGDAADLRLIGPFENNAPEFTVVEGPGAEPGLVRRRHGGGLCIRLPWQIGALYHRHGLGDYRAVLAPEVEAAAGLPPLVTDAPTAVECILYAHPRGHVLHLVNGASGHGSGVIDAVPLAGFTVALRFEAGAALRLDAAGETALPLARGPDGLLRLTIERLDGFAAIALPATNPHATSEETPG